MLTVHVLGTVEVHRDGEPLELGGPLQRAVVAHLALDAGRVVSVDRLIDRLWGDDPPGTPLGSLQSYVSRLRRVLEPHRAAGSAAEVLVSRAPGYLLAVEQAHVDLHRFRSLVAEGRAALATDELDRALARLEEALALWRGPALDGVGPDDVVAPIVRRLEEERWIAREDRFDVLLALGRHTDTVPRLHTAISEQPLRERLWAQLALALYRSSRQADALRAIDDARTLLLDQLGLDPGPELRQLEARILAHDPTLLLAPTTRPTVAPAAIEPTVELLGRSAELDALSTALARSAGGTSTVVLVEGEPGMGKSALCEVFVEMARGPGRRVAVGRGVEPGLAPTLWPMIEMARMLLDTSDAGRDGGPWRHLALGARDASPSASPVELADHFLALVGTQPTVLVLDDAHWADAVTLAVVRLLVERAGERPLLVVIAFRPPSMVPGSALQEALPVLRRAASATVEVAVSPLRVDAVGELIRQTTGSAPSDDTARRVHARAGGNPLFVAELARLAGERGIHDDSVVPDAIRDVVRERLSALPERSRAELEVAAVLGERFDLRTIVAASERDADDCLDALDAAIVTRILVPERDGFRFAHALIRDAVLAEVSSLRAARLHGRAAAAILATRGDGPDDAEPLAHHWLAAATLADPVVVAKAAVRASDVARWRGALDAADRFADAALDVVGATPRTPESSAVEVDALEALMSSALRRADPAAAARAVRRVDEHASRTGSDAAAALSLFVEFGVIDDLEDLRELEPKVQRVRDLASRTTDPYALVTTNFMLAAESFLRGRLDDAAQAAGRAIVASGAEHPDAQPDHVPLVVLPVVAALIAAVRGERDEALDHSHRRATAWLANRSQVDPTAPVALAFNRALVHAVLDEPDRVELELRDLHGDSRHGFVADQQLTCDVLLGWARARRGDPEGARAAAVAMREIDRRSEHVLRAALRTFVADAHLCHGDPAALELLAVAEAGARRRDEVWWLAETLRLRAIAEQRWGDAARASALRAEAVTLAELQGARLIAHRLHRSER